MPHVKFTKVLSCTSEIPEFPAENLVRSEAFAKWKSQPGAEYRTSSVVLQLDRSTTIEGIDIGNEGSAFVEMLVGRSAAADKNYDLEVLLPTVTMMSLKESRDQTDMHKVRMFKKSDFVQKAAEQKWDVLKVICTQPFNKQSTFGLSFVRLMAPEENKPNTATTPNVSKHFGKFTLRSENELETTPTVGSMFKKVHAGGSDEKMTPARPTPQSEPSKTTAVSSKPRARDEIKPVTHNQTAEKQKPTKGPSSSGKAPTSTPQQQQQITPKRKQSDKRETSEAASSSKKHRPNQGDAAGTSSQNGTATTTRPKRAAAAVGKKVPFNKLLHGCTIVLSGFVNPERGDLRTKALQMGAKYQNDWNDTCTHLICAFANTPKAREVKRRGTGGKIVKKQWIIDGHRQRKRLHWRLYALDKQDQSNTFSDEELRADDDNDGDAEESQHTQQSSSQSTTKTKQQQPQHQSQDTDPDYKPDSESESEQEEEDDDNDEPESSGENTDEEVERIKAGRPKKQKKKEKPAKDESKASSSASGLKLDADGLPILPDFFDGMKFFILSDVTAKKRREVTRSVTAFNGVLAPHMDPVTVTHVITNKSWSAEFDEIIGKNANIKFVKPDWMIDCWESNSLADIQPHLVNKST